METTLNEGAVVPSEGAVRALNRAAEYFRERWGYWLDKDSREMANLYAEYGEGLDEIARLVGLEPRAGWPRVPIPVDGPITPTSAVEP